MQIPASLKWGADALHGTGGEDLSNLVDLTDSDAALQTMDAWVTGRKSHFFIHLLSLSTNFGVCSIHLDVQSFFLKTIILTRVSKKGDFSVSIILHNAYYAINCILKLLQ